ncbi:MAG: lysylphosphatidylglycerol synthase domain-containing protein [Acidobacteriota bacterium]
MKSRHVLTLVGFGLLAALIGWIGPATLLRQLAALKWVLPVLMALGLVKHALRAWAWKRALDAEGVLFPFPELLRVRIGSQALAYLSSMGLLVSEPLKPWLLRKKAPIARTIPATLVEAGVYWSTSLLITTIGTFAAVHLVASGHDAWTLSVIAVVIFAAVVLLLFAPTPLLPGLAGYVAQRSGGGSKWAMRLEKAAEMEKQMRSFRLRKPGTVVAIFGFHMLLQVVMFAEVWMVLRAVGVRIDIFYLTMIEAASRIVKMMSFFIPGRVGADEAGAAGAFLLIGLSPAAGLTLAVARRIQALFWTAIGLLWLGRGPVAQSGFPAAETQAKKQPVRASGARADSRHGNSVLGKDLMRPEGIEGEAL